VFRRHAGQFPPTESLHYVMDNLSSHRAYPFCRLVAELSGIECPSEQNLPTQAERVEWLAREDKRIVIHFTPYHGSWLNLVEIWFAIMGGKVLSESFASPDEIKTALDAFMADWNTLLAHPFQWSYDGKGLHEKAVQRFTKMLHSSGRNHGNTDPDQADEALDQSSQGLLFGSLEGLLETIRGNGIVTIPDDR